jgi:hypothetical protein
MKCTFIGGKRCNCSCFEIDQEMDAILLIIDIVYGVCRIVISVSTKCTNQKKTDKIGYTGRRQTKQKQNTLCVGHHYAQINTNNVNKTSG